MTAEGAAPGDPAAASAVEETAVRAARNTVARAVGEIVGKLASFVLFAALARKVGQAQLGVFVFAFAWTQVATEIVGIGLDRYLLIRVAVDRASHHELFWEVLRTKLVRSLPIAALSFALLWALGYNAETRDTVYLLTLGLTIDTISRTLFVVFAAIEKVQMHAVALITQRVIGAALGITALALGYGVVAVALTYTVGAAAGMALGLIMIRRALGIRFNRLERDQRRALGREARPFAAQDIFGILLAKVDTVLLSLIATTAAVGRYGASYRLLEATFFLSWAVAGAFAAMFTYLTPDSEPPILAVYQRALKLTFVLLVPCALAFGLLARPLSKAFFGAELASAADSLRLLAPVMVLLALIGVVQTLVLNRGDRSVVARITAWCVGLNIVLNLALIPLFAEVGAAAAMLATSVVCLVWLTFAATRTVGRVSWVAVLRSPAAAGAAMAAATLALSSLPAVALAAGLLAYLAVLLAAEMLTDPVDLHFMTGLVRRRLARRRPA